MKNTAKICICLLLATTATGVFAGGPPPRREHGGNNGVRLAADIVRLVGASVNTLNSIVSPPATVVVRESAVQSVVVTPFGVVPQATAIPLQPYVVLQSGCGFFAPPPPPRVYAPVRRAPRQLPPPPPAPRRPHR